MFNNLTFESLEYCLLFAVNFVHRSAHIKVLVDQQGSCYECTKNVCAKDLNLHLCGHKINFYSIDHNFFVFEIREWNHI